MAARGKNARRSEATEFRRNVANLKRYVTNIEELFPTGKDTRHYHRKAASLQRQIAHAQTDQNTYLFRARSQGKRDVLQEHFHGNDFGRAKLKGAFIPVYAPGDHAVPKISGAEVIYKTTISKRGQKRKRILRVETTVETTVTSKEGGIIRVNVSFPREVIADNRKLRKAIEAMQARFKKRKFSGFSINMGGLDSGVWLRIRDKDMAEKAELEFRFYKQQYANWRQWLFGFVATKFAKQRKRRIGSKKQAKQARKKRAAITKGKKARISAQLKKGKK